MNRVDDKLVNEAKKYVFELINTNISKKLLYHSVNHTKDVLKNAELIGSLNNLSNEDFNILRISTIFHDIGFIEVYDGHEEISVLYARQFLKERDVNESIINEISTAIMATKVPQKPKNLISRILCDADLMNLSHEEKYLKDVELLREEWIKCGKEAYSQQDFYQVTLDFFKNHHFHTEYGKNILRPKKDRTEEILIEVMNK